MPTTTPRSSTALASRISDRRTALGLSVERAARLAGTTVSSWLKYERGGGIGAQKVNGVCRALQWADLDGTPAEYDDQSDRPGWSLALALLRGDACAAAYADASDAVLECVEHDLALLAALPAGTHLGQAGESRMRERLPEFALVRYDHEFLVELRDAVEHVRRRMQEQAGSTRELFARRYSYSAGHEHDPALASLAHRLIAAGSGEWREAIEQELDSEHVLSASSTVRARIDDHDRRRLLDRHDGPHLCAQCVIATQQARLDHEIREHAARSMPSAPYATEWPLPF